MGLSRTVSEINGDFSRKSQIFPNPYIWRDPDRREPKKRETEERDTEERETEKGKHIFSRKKGKRKIEKLFLYNA